MATKPKKPAKEKAPKAKKSNPKADQATKTKRASKGTKAVQAPPPADDDGRKLPGKRAIQTLSKDFLTVSTRAQTAAGTAGKLLSEAAKKLHLNVKEFKNAHALKQLGQKDPGKLRVVLSDRDYYRECLELDKLAGDGLFDAAEGRPVMEDDDDDAGEETSGEAEENAAQDDGAPSESDQADNVHQLGRGRTAA